MPVGDGNAVLGHSHRHPADGIHRDDLSRHLHDHVRSRSRHYPGSSRADGKDDDDLHDLLQVTNGATVGNAGEPFDWIAIGK
jgi:hypothetical protein